MKTESIHRPSNFKPATGLLLRRSPTTQRSSRIPWPRPFHIPGPMGPTDESQGQVRSNQITLGKDIGERKRGIWVRGCFQGRCDSVGRCIDSQHKTRGSRAGRGWSRCSQTKSTELAAPTESRSGPVCVPVLSELMSSVHQSFDEQEGPRFTALFAA